VHLVVFNYKNPLYVHISGRKDWLLFMIQKHYVEMHIYEI